MKIKTSELSGEQLDWAVECAKGTFWSDNGYFCFKDPERYDRNPEYRYSTEWSQGGPIIEREGIDIRKVGPSEWEPAVVWCGLRRTADNERFLAIHGPTPLIATMRCYVAFKLGEEVDIPLEVFG